MSMSNDDKIEHYVRMLKLEKKVHSGTPLKPEEADALKQLHTAHGAGLFDDAREWLAKMIWDKHPVFKFLRGKGTEAKAKL